MRLISVKVSEFFQELLSSLWRNNTLYRENLSMPEGLLFQAGEFPLEALEVSGKEEGLPGVKIPMEHAAVSILSNSFDVLQKLFNDLFGGSSKLSLHLSTEQAL